VKFFGWLLLQNRLQYCVNLYRKGILEVDTCVVFHGSLETEDHLFRDCPFAAASWAKLRIDSIPDTMQLWAIGRRENIPQQLFPTFILM
jgi:hypothetical protein